MKLLEIDEEKGAKKIVEEISRELQDSLEREKIKWLKNKSTAKELKLGFSNDTLSKLRNIQKELKTNNLKELQTAANTLKSSLKSIEDWKNPELTEFLTEIIDFYRIVEMHKDYRGTSWEEMMANSALQSGIRDSLTRSLQVQHEQTNPVTLALLKKALHSEDAKIRKIVIQDLAKRNDTETLALLQEQIETPLAEKETAADALLLRSDPDSLKILIEMMMMDKKGTLFSEEFRIRVLKSTLKGRSDLGSLRIIQMALESDNWKSRWAAANALESSLQMIKDWKNVELTQFLTEIIDFYSSVEKHKDYDSKSGDHEINRSLQSGIEDALTRSLQVQHDQTNPVTLALLKKALHSESAKIRLIAIKNMEVSTESEAEDVLSKILEGQLTINSDSI